MSDPANRPRRAERQYRLSRILRDGGTHRAASLAARLNVSERTIYRDIARLQQAGLPVSGTPGSGYRCTAALTLPPLNLTVEELEALHLGLTVVAEVADPDLQAAARTLAARLDAALPAGGRLPEGGWQFDVFPFAEGATAFHLIPTLRKAVQDKAKLQIVMRDAGPAREVWPLSIEFWGRIWTCVIWDAEDRSLREIRVDEVTRMTVLPDRYPDMPGRRYEDWLDSNRHAAAASAATQVS